MKPDKAAKIMDHPFPRSVSMSERCRRLAGVVSHRDTLGILIEADPDSMASALALKRFLWRKVNKVLIYRINHIKRADNLAFTKLLKIEQDHIKQMKHKRITRWAIVDSQPHHHKEFMGHQFDIIIDHHPVLPTSGARFVDIREDYGATSTIMTEYLRAAKIKPSTRLATALFYGIKTDTHNFATASISNDINAFRYLYKFTNRNTINKIESSEMTRKTLPEFRLALERVVFLDGVTFVHMGQVNTPDLLVFIADFFMKLAETTWSVASGVYNKKLVVIFRNAGFQSDAGKTAQKLFGRWAGSVGGHKGAARAELPLEAIKKETKDRSRIVQFVKKSLKDLK